MGAPAKVQHVSWLDASDRLTELLTKSEGLADLLVAAGEGGKAIEPKTLASSGWALRDMLTEARKIVES